MAWVCRALIYYIRLYTVLIYWASLLGLDSHLFGAPFKTWLGFKVIRFETWLWFDLNPLAAAPYSSLRLLFSLWTRAGHRYDRPYWINKWDWPAVTLFEIHSVWHYCVSLGSSPSPFCNPLSRLFVFPQHAPGVPRILVGNRLHLAFKRQVPTEQARAYAEKNGMTFFEVSPLCNFNVIESFTELSRIVLMRHGMEKFWKPNRGEFFSWAFNWW